MNNLLRTEWLKIRKYRAFWWLIGITALSYPGINYIWFKIYQEIISEKTSTGEIAKSLLGNPFAFPEAWHTVAYFSSYFVFIPAVVVIMFITNEYTYKTTRQNIIDGWSRNEFMTSKMIDVILISLFVTFLCIVVAAVTGYMNTGSGDDVNVWKNFQYMGLFAMQTFSQLSLAFMVGYLVRKAFIALGIFIFYFLIVENILVNLFKYKVNDIGRFLPIEISDRLIPGPAFTAQFNQEAYSKALGEINYHIIYTILLTFIIWLICYRINSRRDL